MNIMGSAKRLTIYIGESDQWEHRPLYQTLLETLKREGMAGATVTRGLAGFGAHSRIHTTALLRLSTDLPVIITVVDSATKVERILPIIGPMVREGLMTIEDVEIIKYTHRYFPELPHEVPVQAVMTTEVAYVQPNTLLARVVELLLRRNLKAVPVVDASDRVMGIITGGDLLERGDVGLRLSLQQQLTPAEIATRLQALSASGKVAADVMTRDPICIRHDAALAEAGRLMIQHGVKRLPVMDASNRLVGMISRSDVLRTLAGGVRLGSELPADTFVSPVGARTAGDIAIRDVPTVAPDVPLETVLDLLVTNPFRRVVVTDTKDRVIGLIIDTALLAEATSEARPSLIEALAAHLPWRKGDVPASHPAAHSAADVMLTDVFSVPAQASLSTVLQQMLERRVKRLIVVDTEGRLIGLVERQALLQALLGGETSS